MTCSLPWVTGAASSRGRPAHRGDGAASMRPPGSRDAGAPVCARTTMSPGTGRCRRRPDARRSTSTRSRVTRRPRAVQPSPRRTDDARMLGRGVGRDDDVGEVGVDIGRRPYRELQACAEVPAVRRFPTCLSRSRRGGGSRAAGARAGSWTRSAPPRASWPAGAAGREPDAWRRGRAGAPGAPGERQGDAKQDNTTHRDRIRSFHRSFRGAARMPAAAAHANVGSWRPCSRCASPSPPGARPRRGAGPVAGTTRCSSASRRPASAAPTCTSIAAGTSGRSTAWCRR